MASSGETPLSTGAKAGAHGDLGELGRELGPVETFFWKAAHDPYSRSVNLAVWLLDRAPDWDRLVETWDRLSRLVPRFRQRIVEPPLGFPPRWVVDPDVDLTYHMRRIRAPEPGTLRQVLDLARPLIMADFDPARPRWETTLVEGLEEGRAALILKADHTMGDGQGSMRMFEILFDTTRDPDPAPMPATPETEDASAAALLRSVLGERLHAAPRQGLKTFGELLGVVGSVAQRPGHSVSRALAFTASAGRMFGPVRTPRSAVLQGRSRSCRFDILELSLDDLRRSGKAVGGTINDTFLAALSGGLRRYHERMGAPVERLAISVPISTRRADDPLASNRFSAAFVVAPIGVAEPRVRTELIHDDIRRLRSEPALGLLNDLYPPMRLLPQSLFRTIMQTATPDVAASTIPGFDIDLYTAGAKILRLYGFGQRSGLAVMVGLVSMFGTCCVTIHSDPAAVTEPHLFVACLREGFEEVLDLGGPHQDVTLPAAL